METVERIQEFSLPPKGSCNPNLLQCLQRFLIFDNLRGTIGNQIKVGLIKYITSKVSIRNLLHQLSIIN